jgi:hypothetical protein
MADADLEKDPAAAATFASLSPAVTKVKSMDSWKRALTDALYRTQKLELFRSSNLSQISKAGESERDFRIRLQQTAREERDSRVEQLRQQYAPKLAALQDRIRRAHNH